MQGYHIVYKQTRVLRASWWPAGPAGSADTPSAAFRRHPAARPSRCANTGGSPSSSNHTVKIHTHTHTFSTLEDGNWGERRLFGQVAELL